MFTKLGYVRVFVSDFERALRFYHEVLEIPITMRMDEMGWAQLDTGAATLAINYAPDDDPESEELVGRFVGATLMTKDLDSTYKTLVARGVDFVEAPERQPWGGYIAHFRDPDQNVFTVLEDDGR